MVVKEIQRLKLSVTTACNLRCRYCFVKKTSQDMPLAVARRSVDLLLGSAGYEKVLSLYGGEPLLRFRLLEDIVPYALSRARLLGKKLIIACCTNATLLEENHVRFFKEYGVRVHVSLFPDRTFHNRYRCFPGGRGSYGLVREKLDYLRRSMPPELTGACLCVLPSSAHRIQKDWRYLVDELGMSSVNIELIRDFSPWSRRPIVDFLTAFQGILKDAAGRVRKKDFMFINGVCWQLKHRYSSSTNVSYSDLRSCPCRFYLEVYPRGEMTFSPFLMNQPSRARYLVGNINKKKGWIFKACSFDDVSSKCRACFGRYVFYPRPLKYDPLLHRYYHALIDAAARDLSERAKHSQAFLEYVQEACRRAT